MKTFTLEQYLIFLTYALEFRSLVLEQLSHEIEKKYVTEHGAENNTSYGVVLLDFTIRDMKGLMMYCLSKSGEHGFIRLKSCSHWGRRKSSCSSCFKFGTRLVSIGLLKLIGLNFYFQWMKGNYPECLGKCHIINVPWVFNSMWYFIKAMLDEQ